MLERWYAAYDMVVADPERAKWDKGVRPGGACVPGLGRQNVSLDLGRFSETLARLHLHALLQRWRQVSSRPQR